MKGLWKFAQDHEALVWIAAFVVALASWVAVLKWAEKRDHGGGDPYRGLAPELFESESDMGVAGGNEQEWNLGDSFGTCRDNLDVIAGWLYKYKTEHGGRAPQTMEEFHKFQDFVAATGGWTREQSQELLFTCPVTGEPYKFFPGASKPTDILIAETKPCHGDQCYVILVNEDVSRRRLPSSTSP